VNSPDLQHVYAQLYKLYGPQHWWPADSPFEVIVGAILTQSTHWKNVERAIENLKRHKALTPSRLHTLSEEKLAQLIRPAGSFRQKAKKLKNFVEYLYTHHQGSLSKMLAQPTKELRSELLSIWGIGPETADSILLYAGQKPVFVVDAYTKRVFSRLGLVSSDISYGELQKFFMHRLPRDAKLFNEYHALIVRHGKETCGSQPRCERCVLAHECQFCRRSSSALGR
jgi:endonuclease-3 related protein